MRRNLALLIAVLPAALGFLTWQAFRYGWLTDSILYLRTNLGLLLFLTGLLLSILLRIGFYFYLHLERRAQKASDAARYHFSTEHR